MAGFIHCPLQAQTVTLQWDASAGATSYRVWAAPVGSDLFSPISVWTATVATVGADTNQPTKFYVTAIQFLPAISGNTFESLPSNVVTNFPAMIAPSGLRGSRTSGNRVELAWSSDSRYPTRIEQALNGGQFAQVAIIPAGVMHATVPQKNSASAAYRVRSCDQICSGYSSVITIADR